MTAIFSARTAMTRRKRSPPAESRSFTFSIASLASSKAASCAFTIRVGRRSTCQRGQLPDDRAAAEPDCVFPVLAVARDYPSGVPVPGIRGQPLHAKRMASHVKDTAWLEWMAGLMGLGSRQTHTATLPPGQFHCLLDELPLHLIPQHQLQSQCWWLKLPPQQLFLNPECSVSSPGRVPAELEPHRYLLKNFYLQGTVAWVRDPATRSLHPFWLGPRLQAAVSRLRAGEPASDSIPADDAPCWHVLAF